MPISSLIIRTDPHHTESIQSQLNSLAGVNVETTDGTNIVIVTDTASQKQDKDLWKTIEAITGVLQCDLIYHNFEDDTGVGRG